MGPMKGKRPGVSRRQNLQPFKMKMQPMGPIGAAREGRKQHLHFIEAALRGTRIGHKRLTLLKMIESGRALTCPKLIGPLAFANIIVTDFEKANIGISPFWIEKKYESGVKRFLFDPMKSNIVRASP